MHGCQWLKLEGLLRTSPDMHLLGLFGMTHIVFSEMILKMMFVVVLMLQFIIKLRFQTNVSSGLIFDDPSFLV